MKHTFTQFLVGCLFLVGYTATTSAQNNTWTAKASFTGAARTYAMSFVIGSKAYIVGGENPAFQLLKSVWVYDATTNSWNQLADFAGTPRKGAGCFTIGNKAYIVGGQDSTGVVKDVWEFDPTGGTWTAKTEFPGTARAYAASFAIGNKGYYGLGVNDSDMWEYNPTNDTWTQKTGLAGVNSAFVLSFVIDNKAYCAGGSPSLGFKQYDPATDTWTNKNDSAEATERSEGIAFVVNNTGYIGMGTVPFTNGADLWAYNPTTDMWTKRQGLGAMPRIAAAGFTVNNRGYVTTGQNVIGLFVSDLNQYTGDSAAAIYNVEVANITSPICAGQTINLAYTTSTNFNNGNQFVAQLSDSLGSFDNAISLDTVAATGNGNFECTIPSNTANGIGYRIRAIATNPVTIGTASNPFITGAKPIITSMVGDSAVRINNAYFYGVTNRVGSTFLWSFTNGTGTSTTNTIAITWTTSGQTRLGVVETTLLGCASDTLFKNIQITDPVGLQTVTGTSIPLSVFPNPGSGLFFIQGLQEQAIIRDVIGNELMTIEKDGTIDLTAFPAGIYFIQSGSVIQKIIKY
jgi:N-acetylneuraminic acid mutarotase